MIRLWPWLFIAIPLVELYLIIKVGGLIGAFWTVVLVVLTAVIGVNLLRLQGFSTLQRARHSMLQGQLPAMEMLEGMLLAIAGVLLLTPGFVTDTLGFLCLLPGFRQALIRRLLASPNVHFGGPAGGAPFRDATRPAAGDTIEGEFTRKD